MTFNRSAASDVNAPAVSHFFDEHEKFSHHSVPDREWLEMVFGEKGVSCPLDKYIQGNLDK